MDRIESLVSQDVLEAGVPLLSAQELAIGYEDLEVCEPATFTLDAGQALALVGVNGAGKSTLARTCLGLLPAIDGQCQLLGSTPDPRRSHMRRAVAWELGDGSFFPTLSVREHLELVAMGHATPHADKVIDDVIEEFAMESFVGALPDHLSSGQRRKALLASTLIRPHSLLVLDEPEQRLDHVTRLLLGQRLRTQRDAGAGILFVTHDADLVRTLATQVLLVGHDTRLLEVEEGAAALEAGAL